MIADIQLMEYTLEKVLRSNRSILSINTLTNKLPEQ